jgi:peroxiredoxin
MTIAVGQRLPDVTFKVMRDGKPADVTTAEVFGGKTVVLFSVPGAYTPTCHMKHLPSFITHAADLKAKGVDTIACTAVNDVYVLHHWAKDTGATDSILFLADGSATFAKAIGMDIDLGGFGLGTRARRYAMLVKDGVVSVLNIEKDAGKADLSGAEEMLKSL